MKTAMLRQDDGRQLLCRLIGIVVDDEVIIKIRFLILLPHR